MRLSKGLQAFAAHTGPFYIKTVGMGLFLAATHYALKETVNA